MNATTDDSMARRPGLGAATELFAHALVGRFLKLRLLHRDQQGTISILSVIVILLLTMLLGLVLNVGEQIDDKIRMQNAADAATYSTGVVVARGMNTIAFTNHLLSEVFALTAYFREGRDRYAESLVPQILGAWSMVASQVPRSRFERIRDIGPALIPKMEMEQEVVTAFGDMTEKKSQFMLPALETILGQSEVASLSGGNGGGASQQEAAQSHLIPQFQRQVVRSTAMAAHLLAQEVTRRHLPTRTSGAGAPICLLSANQSTGQSRDESDPYERILPALDPSFEGPDFQLLRAWEAGTYQQAATQRRRDLARQYLSDWNGDRNFDLGPFEREFLSEGGRVSAKMSQFINLWRGFTCAKLNQLLDVEYPYTNLPHMLRFANPSSSQQQYLDHDFTFSAIVYRRQRQQTMPGMYRVPNSGDAIAFARVAVFVPRPRYQWSSPCPIWSCPSYDWWGTLRCGIPCFDSWPTEWSLFNQNWAARMIPASPEVSLSMLNSNPQGIAPGVRPQAVNSMTIEDFKSVNTH